MNKVLVGYKFNGIGNRFYGRRYTSNIKVGDRATIYKIVTEEDLEAFANLTGDWNYIHFSKMKTKSIVHGVLLNGYVSQAFGMKVPGPGTVLVEQILKFPNPCFVGEEIKITVEVISARKIIECKFVCSVFDKIVLEGVAKLIRKNSIFKE